MSGSRERTLWIEVDPQVKVALKEAARRKGLRMSAWIRVVIHAALDVELPGWRGMKVDDDDL